MEKVTEGGSGSSSGAMTSIFYLDIACRLSGPGGRGIVAVPPSAIRGALKTAFRRQVWCLHPDRIECGDCSAIFGCPFGLLFDPRVPPWSTRRRSEREIPSALRVVPPDDDRKASFRLLLMGRGAGLWPFVRTSLDRLVLEMPDPRPVGLLDAVARHPDGDVPLVVRGRDTGHQPPICRLPPRPLHFERAVTVRFLTPLQLGMPEPRDPTEVTFLRLMKSVLGQLSSIAYFHAAEAIDLDFRDLLKAAGDIRATRHRLTRVTGTHTSSARQGHREIPLDGWVGEIDFEGSELARFGDLLAAAEVVGVGKKTAIGLGRLRVVDGA